jgi:polysaccharide pyruvyl transferase WcaK-like protein
MAPVKILLVNSDLASNRGDRAIAQGLIALVDDVFPGSTVTAISEHASRDREWFGVDVLEQNIHSLSPLDFLRMLRAARRSDVVLWGGGELLKDYTNKLGLWYWAVKMTAVSWIAPRLVGTFQGIGPTSSASSKRIIASLVKRTSTFVTRDEESRDKLIAWGVPAERVVASFDSAVFGAREIGEPSEEAWRRAGLDAAFRESFVTVAPRDWFHYRRGGLIPYRWRRKPAPSADNVAYRARLVEVIDTLVERHGHVLLVPMHMAEDPKLCRDLHAQVQHPSRVRLLDEDNLSPQEFKAVLGRARLMVAFRLHAGIVASSAGVPTITYYYVDKGRLYADQVGASEYTRPIERMLDDDALVDFVSMDERLVVDGTAHKRTATRLAAMRAAIRSAFAQAARQ